ncbi:MAG: alpha-mannosidase [Terracidiphilus sp.]
MSKKLLGLSRRDFLVRGAASLGAIAAAPAFAQHTTEGGSANRKVIHIIGHSHIDAAWLWPWHDGSDEALNTFRSALNRMIETPDFCYSHSSSAHYRWVERADPQMFAEIRQRVKEGRWEVIGGWPVEPDCNIPSTESFVRHSLYGKEYCQRALGADVKIGFNPDSFGHAAGLPTILKAAGYSYYAFMRPQEHEMDLPLLFWWEGADGSRILTLRIWKAYDIWWNGNTVDMIRDAATRAFAPGLDHAAFFLGVGDHGGGVTKEYIQEVLRMREQKDLPELRWSTLSSFFSEIEKSPAFASLPVIKGELEHHARGCYSAYGEGKFLNRRAERWLGEAESISLIANLTANHPYPSQDYAESWWKVLFCQFHDLMSGTALYDDYQDVRDCVGYACETAQTSKVEALETLAKRVDLSGVQEGAVFIFNPLPWRRKALLEFVTEVNPSGHALITHLSSKDGDKIPIQWRPSASMTNFFPRLSAWVDLPPCGYRVLELAHGESPAPQHYSNFFQVSNTGFGISSLKAPDGAELLSASLGLVVIADTSDTWGHDISEFRQEMGRPTFISSTVIENGPVTRVTRQRARWMQSEIVLDIAEFADLDFVELRFVIDWHEREQILKLEIPTALAQPRVFLKTAGAVLERRVNGEEEPYQDWGAIEGKIGNNDYTVALLNNSSYSYDCLKGLFRTILIRSAPFARHNPNQVPHNDNDAWQDQGRQERSFWLLGGKGVHTEFALDRRADELQTPAEYVMDSVHKGSEPWERTFLEIQPENVWVLAIKRAENEDATVIRIQERAGKSTLASIKSAHLGLDHNVSLAPWELKTLLVMRAKGHAKVREVSLLEV